MSKPTDKLKPRRVFKIRREADGLFSSGGSSPRFTRIGKTWSQRSHVTNHLALVKPSVYEGCELITFELQEVELDTCSVGDAIEEIKKNKRLRDEEKRRLYEQWRIKHG